MNVVFDSSFSSTATPVKDGYEFLGWILPDGSELTMPAYWRYAEDVTVTAKWLKTKEVVELRMGYRVVNNNDKYVTDDDKVYDFIDPMMDRQALINQGYTKLSIKVKIYLYEVNDGDKDFWIRPYFDKTGTDIDHVRFSSTQGQWNEHEFSFDVQNLSDSAFNDACAFWLEYGAEGNQGDSWYAGDTWITIEAVK